MSALLHRHLNKMRWFTLCSVFAMLVLLPFLHLYQTYVAAHAYDLLSSNERQIYDVMAVLTAPFVTDPVADLDAIKGNTWSATIGGLKISDPLAVVGQTAAGLSLHWPFAVTALLPVMLTVLLGRFFCGWICPATLIYELNSNLADWLRWAGIDFGNCRFDRRLKYYALGLGVLGCSLTGSVLVAGFYPPVVIGRELYYAVALGGFGAGSAFYLATLLLDLVVARRGFCRYLCPGGALYSLLGRYRLLRIQRKVESCNDCAKCNAVCEFALNPLGDGFGQECNNCAACIAICPTDALTFNFTPTDQGPQGPGHLGQQYRRSKIAVGKGTTHV